MPPLLNKIVVVQHNVSHWENHKIALSNIYNQIDPHIIVLNEHSILNNKPIRIFNYSVFSVNKSNSRNSGAAIAIKKGLQYRLHDNFYSDMLAVTLQSQQGPVTFATTYVPPRTNYINLIDFQSVLHYDHPTYILADINAHHRTLGSNRNDCRGNNINSLIVRRKCTHIGPNFPTFLSHNTATKPDIVLANTHAFLNVHLKPGPITPSDHIPIIATFSANPIQIPIKHRLHFHKANWDTYKHELRNVQVPNNPTATQDEIDNYLQQWTDEIHKASDKAIPLLTHRIIPGIKPNHETLTIQAQYNNTLQDILENGPTRDKYRLVRQLRYQLSTIYKHQYHQNWNNIINNLNTEQDPKIFWSTIKRMTGSNEKQLTPYIKHNDAHLSLPQEKEPLFRYHWQEIYSGIDDPNNDFDADNEDIVNNSLEQYTHLLSSYDTGDISRLDINFPPITIEELNTVLKRTKQKSPGPTKITSLQIKNLPPNMKNYLIYIMNQSISAGYFPTKLKQAIVIFIPKPNTSQHQVKNYRPISLLDTHSKLLDRILNNRLYNALIMQNKLNSRQHGFREHRGTHTALATFHELITQNLAQKNRLDVVLRDVSKAFDKVWHQGLKHKLIKLDLHTSFTKTLINYLCNRTASIRIGNFIGPAFNLLSGVPQGACLSPTLYSYYTHDCPEPIIDSDYVAFADDITQIISSPWKNVRAIAHTTQHSIKQINNYENKWKIKTNTGKFTLIPISRNKTADVYVNNELIPYKNAGKALGLNFGTRGFSNQVKVRTAIANSNLNKILRFQYLSANNKRKLYLSLVRSALTYPIIPLHTASDTQILKLQRVQNRGVRFITGSQWQDFYSSEYLHLTTNIPPINIFLHNSAKDLWEKIELLEPELFNKLKLPDHLVHHQHCNFRSSQLISSQPTPDAIYV